MFTLGYLACCGLGFLFSAALYLALSQRLENRASAWRSFAMRLEEAALRLVEATCEQQMELRHRQASGGAWSEEITERVRDLTAAMKTAPVRTEGR